LRCVALRCLPAFKQTNQELHRELELKEKIKMEFKVHNDIEQFEVSRIPDYIATCKEVLAYSRSMNQTEGKVNISVPQRFRLQAMFDKWFEKKNFLLRPLNREERSLFFNGLYVSYEGKSSSPHYQNHIVAFMCDYV
jgi:hypothetical protein